MKWKEKNKASGSAGTSGRGLEERLSEYRHRMELVRTIMGFVLLCIQVWLFFHFSSK